MSANAASPTSSPGGMATVITMLQDDRDLIATFVTKVTGLLKASRPHYEIVLIDNGSSDDTVSEVQRLQQIYPNIHYIRLSRSYDPETAFTAGLENSLGDHVIIMDVRHDPPEAIPLFLASAAQGHEVVIGEATDLPRPFYYRLGEKIFYRLARRCLAFPLNPKASNFRCLSRQVVNSITRMHNKSRSLKYLNAVVGFRHAHIEYELNRARPGEFSLTRFLKSVSLGISIITSHSAVPLRFASFLGLIASLLSAAYVAYIFAVSLFKTKVAEGWITTNIITTMMFFLLFFILTILAEYIARILQEAQDRPLYFVEFESYSSETFYQKELAERLNID